MLNLILSLIVFLISPTKSLYWIYLTNILKDCYNTGLISLELKYQQVVLKEAITHRNY